uniref:Secreted protein n=1 Tax=Brugia timori TaxID=42155 RepID=A0A0R3Q941_9BILA
LLPGVGRYCYVIVVVIRLLLQLMSHTIRPCYLIEGLNGYQYRITLVQCRGARSLTDDLIPGQFSLFHYIAKGNVFVRE